MKNVITSLRMGLALVVLDFCHRLSDVARKSGG
jgi:hypothetical protein